MAQETNLNSMQNIGTESGKKHAADTKLGKTFGTNSKRGILYSQCQAWEHLNAVLRAAKHQATSSQAWENLQPLPAKEICNRCQARENVQ